MERIPPGYLDLITQKSYTVPQTRDIINRHLLDRGFTLLRHGEVLSVVNLKKLNPGMVPRVSPEQLADRDPHEFVRVMFKLDSLVAEAAVAEFKPMLSPNGKLEPLKISNRLVAMDTVGNLRDIHSLLMEKQSDTSQKQLVRSFKLHYTRAIDVKETLEQLLGVAKKKSGPMSPQQQRAAQQLALAKAKKKGGASKPKVNVYIVAIERDNSILANAPPDKIAYIAQAIKEIDQPLQRRSLLQNMNGMRVYRLPSGGYRPRDAGEDLGENGRPASEHAAGGGQKEQGDYRVRLFSGRSRHNPHVGGQARRQRASL